MSTDIREFVKIRTKHNRSDSKSVTFSIPEEMHESLCRICDEVETTKSELMRISISRLIKAYDDKRVVFD